MKDNNNYVVVIGGLNIDLAGISGDVYREKDSNIGKVSINVGGVGHNIACNLVKLKCFTYFVTVYGDDYFGEIAAKECAYNHINISYSEKIVGGRTSTYLYVADNTGEMVTGINDMKIVEHITPKFLEERSEFLDEAALCILDGNLSQETLEWAAENIKAPIFADPVSVAKVSKFENILDKIDTMKPNTYEIELLTGIKVFDESSAKQAAQKLNTMGVKNVFLSMGEKGILCANKNEVHFIPTLSKNIVNTNGAGDSTMAALAWSRIYFNNELDLKEIGQLTQAAASITVESNEAVSPELNPENVLYRSNIFLN